MSNGTREIYLNASAYKKLKEGALKSLLAYIKNNEVSDDFTKKLNTFIEATKENQEAKNMYEAVKLKIRDERADAERRGCKKERKKLRSKLVKSLTRVKKFATDQPESQAIIKEFEECLKNFEKDPQDEDGKE